MDYTNYLKKLIEKAEETQLVLDEWKKDGELDEDDTKLLGIVSRLVGYCQAMDGLLEEDKEK